MKNNINTDFKPSPSTRDAWVLLCLAATFYIITSFALQKFSIMVGLLVAQVLCFLLPALLYAKWKTSTVQAALRLRPVPAAILLRVAMLALAGFGLADLIDRAMHPVIAHYFADWIPAMKALLEMLTPKTPQGLLGSLCVIGIVGPICEEMLFRGAFQGTLEQRGPVRAIAVTSMMFGLLHLNPFNFFGPILFGVALGFVAWRLGSVLPAILWHAIFNSAVIMSLYFGGVSFSMPLWLDAGLAVLFALLLWEFIRHTRYAAPKLCPLATAPAVIHGGVFCLVNVTGCVCALLLLIVMTCFGRVSLDDDSLAPDYRAGDIVIYTRGLAFRPENLRVNDVVIYKDGKDVLRFSRVLSYDTDKITVSRPALPDGKLSEELQRKDVIGKSVWKFDPGEEVRQLARQMKVKQSSAPKGDMK